MHGHGVYIRENLVMERKMFLGDKGRFFHVFQLSLLYFVICFSFNTPLLLRTRSMLDSFSLYIHMRISFFGDFNAYVRWLKYYNVTDVSSIQTFINLKFLINMLLYVMCSLPSLLALVEHHS